MNIEVNMNEITSVEKIISTMLVENDFNKMNELVEKSKINDSKFIYPNSIDIENANFISIKKSNARRYVKIMSELEFYKIVGLTKKGLSKRSGKYQEYLYGNYLKAIEENDEGYIADILNKALEFKTNLDYVKSLMRKKSFLREWKKNFINETAIEVFKNRGTLKIINIINERSKHKPD